MLKTTGLKIRGLRGARVVRSLVFVVVGLSLAGCAGSGQSQSDGAKPAEPSLPPVVATVNGRDIPTKFYEMYVKDGREALGLDPSTAEGQRKLDLLREGVVSDLIDRALVMQDAERRGLTIPPERVAQEERRVVAEHGGDAEFDKYLASHKLTRDEYRETLKMPLYGELLRAELRKSVSVSDEEVKAYYESNRSEPLFQKSEQVKAAHILIAARPNVVAQQLQSEKNLSGAALDAAVREEMARRRARAEELRSKAAAAGADFAALARQASEDPGTRERGGDLGTFTRNSHPRVFDDAAFSLKPGEVSRVVQTDYGFHIIKTYERELGRTLSLDEAAPDIRRRLLAQKEAQTLKDWLKEMRRKATIRINEPFRLGALKQEFPAA